MRLPLKTRVAAYSMGPTKFALGLEFEYNNPGMATAGRIIEVVSGMPYERFLQERLFARLGMKDTTFTPNAERDRATREGLRPQRRRHGIGGDSALVHDPAAERSGPSALAGRRAAVRRLAISRRSSRSPQPWAAPRPARAEREVAAADDDDPRTGYLINLGRGEHGYGYGWWTSHKSRARAARCSSASSVTAARSAPT